MLHEQLAKSTSQEFGLHLYTRLITQTFNTIQNLQAPQREVDERSQGFWFNQGHGEAVATPPNVEGEGT